MLSIKRQKIWILDKRSENKEENMKKLMMKLGNIVAGLALIAATLNVNSTCAHHIYQEPVPDSAKKLAKLK